jgi:hypothetical protein
MCPVELCARWLFLDEKATNHPAFGVQQLQNSYDFEPRLLVSGSAAFYNPVNTRAAAVVLFTRRLPVDQVLNRRIKRMRFP